MAAGTVLIAIHTAPMATAIAVLHTQLRVLGSWMCLHHQHILYSVRSAHIMHPGPLQRVFFIWHKETTMNQVASCMTLYTNSATCHPAEQRHSILWPI